MMKPVIILVSVFLLSALLFRWFVVYLTGILEYLLGISLLFIQTRAPGSVVLILLLLLLLPANIWAAVNRINPEKADCSEKGIKYLWTRMPVQLFVITWVWYFYRPDVLKRNLQGAGPKYGLDNRIYKC